MPAASAPSRWKRVLKRSLQILAGSMALLLIVGALYELIAARRDAQLFPQQGRSVQLGPEFQNVSLNLDCSGPEAADSSAPTVILDSGLGVPAVGWKFVQAEVAKFARVCSYDRAGYGWSSASTAPRTSLQLAKELHALLQAAGEKGPFVLVAHSFGGYNVRVYAGQYPQDVAGMVLVDASHEDQLSRMPPAMRALLKPPSDSQLRVVGVLRALGILRALGGDPSAGGLPKDFARQLNYLQHSRFMAATAAELRSFEQSAAQVRDAGTLGDRPLIVLTAGKYDSPLELPMGISRQDIDEKHRIWVDELQVSLAELSTRGKRLIIEDSTHMIPFERPDAVVAAVREVSEAARTGSTVAPATPQAAQVQSPAVAVESTARALTKTDVEAWLDGFMPYALESGDIAGAVVVVVKDGAVLSQKGYGYADVAARTPVDPERTLFRPGSIAKLFTWTAVMQLVEQGKLDLDADVNGYLDFKIPAREDQPITLRNILTHTPGFEEQGKGVFATDRDHDLTLETYVKRWTPQRIFPPGSTPAYSNYATALAGYIVERVSGQSFDDYMEQHLFAPLGMERSTFRHVLPEKLRADMSKGYAQASLPAKAYELVPAAPAGSMASTGADMARFMIAHLQNGAYADNRILKSETAQQMHTTALTMIPPLDRMLLGFYETNYNGHRVISHGGDTGWFHSYLHLFIDDGVGLYVSFNSSGKGAAVGGARSMLFTEFSDRYLTGPTSDGTVDARLAAEHAQLLAAHRYESSRRSQSNFLSIASLVGQLTFVANDDGTIGIAGSPRKWREIAPFVWREVNGKALLAAKVENNRVVRFGLNGAPYMVFEPAPWSRSSAWLTPLLLVGIGALALTALFWPVTALIRRHYRVQLDLAGTDLKAYRLSRIAATAVIVVLGAWIFTVTASLSESGWLSPRLDGWFWILQLSSLIVFVGAAAIALWNTRVVWEAKRGWLARAWSVVIAVSCLTVLWVALVSNLIAFDVNY